jgi:hypothetical protein
MNFIQKALFGYVTKAVSKRIVDSVKWFYKKYKKEIDGAESALLGVDDWIERKIGSLVGADLDLPDEIVVPYEKAIRLAFDTVEDNLTDGAKWRMLIRAVRSGSIQGLAEEKINQLKDKPWSYAKEQLPKEAREYLSKLKERLARLKFREIWGAFMGDKDRPEEKHIKASLAIRAEEHKEEKKTLEDLIKESKERQALLGG